MMGDGIAVAVVEDQNMLRGALEALISLEDDMAVIGSYASVSEAKAGMQSNYPDVLVTDVELGAGSGFDIVDWISTANPCTKIIVLTTFRKIGYLRRASQSRVNGYLLKEVPAEELISAIRLTHSGNRVIAPELALAVWDNDLDALTGREVEVLRLAKCGESTEKISKSLRISVGTVRNHLSSAISKLRASNRHEAVAVADARGLL